MNAGEQAPLAPFLALRSRREPPAHGEAFDLERGERGGNGAGIETERGRKRVSRDWA